VEKVWNRSKKLGEEQHTIIIHGKHNHEETRATFSHSSENAPALVVKDLAEAKILAEIILGKKDAASFYTLFEGKHSPDFDVEKHFEKVGVVNQTTMLASETQEIADFIRTIMIEKYGEAEIKEHFADTRDTLCYATNDNQNATLGLLETDADLALVVGGYNSSNTTHLVELLEEKFPSYFINGAGCLKGKNEIHHFDIHKKEELTVKNFMPNKPVTSIILTSGASCPDALVDEVLQTVLSYFDNTRSIEEVIATVMG
jgi:4-hydroxy-3-methylbut-2-enyl diphosphate reductase